MNTPIFPRKNLVKRALLRLLAFVVVVPAVFFLSAGTLAYWQAWVYLGEILFPMLVFLAFIARKHPDLLERRMRTRETDPRQKTVQWLAFVYFLVFFLIPGLDQRFGWSHPALGWVIFGQVGVLAGYGLVLWTLLTNHYASRVVEVIEEQRVIQHGPYAWVRHPMYLGSILLFAASPLALGSLWGALIALLYLPLMVARITAEEETLLRDLPGYAAYTHQTRYRLFPGIW